MSAIWILGATGRVGTGVAHMLAARGCSLVLVGRDEARLGASASMLGGSIETRVLPTLEATCAAIAREAPAVVLSTIGPFATTAVPVARACPAGTHYVDLSNELSGVRDVLALDEEARAAGTCLVPGAGYGFVGTESLVRALCEGRPTPTRVRVTSIPIVRAGGVVGDALAGSIVHALAQGGRVYRAGELVRAPVGSEARALALPDGRRVVTGSVPSGDLEAARRASLAPDVVATSSYAPTGTLARLALPIAAALFSSRPLRELVVRRFARMRVSAPPSDAVTTSWAHARVEWSDVTREAWLRTDDVTSFTNGVAAEVAARLAEGRARPGAFTPGALFGPSLAEAAGAELRLGTW